MIESSRKRALYHVIINIYGYMRMNNTSNKLAYFLTYAGALPFVFCAISLMIGISQFPYLGSVITILSVYSLMIASFMSGIHWGQSLDLKIKWYNHLRVLSNVNALLIFFSFIFLKQSNFWMVTIIVFAFIIFIDCHIYKQTIITKPYFQMRIIVSCIVIFCLGIAVYAA